ncbi:hypothetical protein NCCP691_39360 [Noviherbaspirillum aridicola]|uniref:Uncharacterized protein n=1 Tax=Noviherbaspirillum aridicola TaxID=2849687 RepID=A0ABQ4Q9M7_9BURK|nr:hypothetical protein NCCP691_39360 [Noviherbaspirillum aridicola]
MRNPDSLPRPPFDDPAADAFIRGQLARLRKARDTLTRERPAVGPDVTVDEVVEIFDDEIARLLRQLA